ncbi:hypothetical protein PGT21_003513 [Puccinia graminis f. sp. tritici]|uniref:Uncharacterized protein n=2 Tax=Puccinia graminis f. sp. tritici TaxID=56615 RepID=E3KJY8_PUCGT|nr:uncharacterized protein PGTG_10772 [Puccinia graminis f. sp. tritici CRL 75-36-700-3]KAA1088634.1 hypothetical protein PGTUg99_011160 [Puccinia graminis f. sp. tritici]EFP84613.1 hypothetical protein PGTG_10772 [Puccinia graminis f. sp. tritici CRL 75-36-700-3]KAA1097335.1 hypothetical protein PGT21_003329 [Puccinia graminis f. sp. tritici]KAA1100987.1 hypothetical protein PGT21_003513 [Puccinia graminis f. sp. tritici]KAA1134313.1 hypothetical protein PGTUg99_035087 [Puccinia graminis f. s
MLHQLLISLGGVLFCHGAYSVYVERILLHGGTSLQYIPSTWLISQLAASFLLLVTGITLSAPPLKNIHWKAELKQRSIDGFDSKMGFINLNTKLATLSKR